MAYNSKLSTPQIEQALGAALLNEKNQYNITQDKDSNYPTLAEAIAAVSDDKYKVNGIVLTYNTGKEWVSMRYNGEDASGFSDEQNWSHETFKADDEDLEQTNGLMKFKDRKYDEANFSGKGYKILRKNIQEVSVPKFDLTISSGCTSDGNITITIGDSPVEVAVTTAAATAESVAALIGAAVPDVTVEGAVVTFKSNPVIDYSTTGVTGEVADNTYTENRNVLTQEMVNELNTIYIIQYDYDLNGIEITIPNGCALQFEGGKLSNGTIDTNNIIGINKIAGISLCNLSEHASFNCEEKNWYLEPNQVYDLYNNLHLVVEFCKKLNIINLYLPEGIYNVSWENPIMLYSNFNIYGKGIEQTILKQIPNNQNSYSVILCRNIENCTINNLKIIGDRLLHDYSTPVNHEWGHGINISNCYNVKVLNCKITEVMGYGITTNFETVERGDEYASFVKYPDLEEGKYDDNGLPIADEGWFRSKIKDFESSELRGGYISVVGWGSYSCRGFITETQTLVVYDINSNFIEKIEYMEGDMFFLPPNAAKFAIEVNAPLPSSWWIFDKNIDSSGNIIDNKKTYVSPLIEILEEDIINKTIYPFSNGGATTVGYSAGVFTGSQIFFYNGEKFIGQVDYAQKVNILENATSYRIVATSIYTDYFYTSFMNSYRCENILVKNCTIEYNRCLGLALNGQDITIDSCFINTNGKMYKGNDGSGMKMNLDIEECFKQNNNIIIKGCTFKNAGAVAVGAKRAMFIDCICYNSSIDLQYRCSDSLCCNCNFYKTELLNILYHKSNNYIDCKISHYKLYSVNDRQFFNENPSKWILENSKLIRTSLALGYIGMEYSPSYYTPILELNNCELIINDIRGNSKNHNLIINSCNGSVKGGVTGSELSLLLQNSSKLDVAIGGRVNILDINNSKIDNILFTQYLMPCILNSQNSNISVNFVASSVLFTNKVNILNSTILLNSNIKPYPGSCLFNGDAYINNSQLIYNTTSASYSKKICSSASVIFNTLIETAGDELDCKNLYNVIIRTSNKEVYINKSQYGDNIPSKLNKYAGMFINTTDNKVKFLVNDEWVTANTLKDGVLNEGTFSQKPDSLNIPIGFAYFCTDKKSPESDEFGITIYYKGDNVWVDSLGRVVDDNYPATPPATSGTTEERPLGVDPGFQYFDTTLNKPIWKSADGWVDSTGASV